MQHHHQLCRQSEAKAVRPSPPTHTGCSQKTYWKRSPMLTTGYWKARINTRINICYTCPPTITAHSSRWEGSGFPHLDT